MQDTNEYLCLPLIWDGFISSSGQEQRQSFLDIRFICHLMIEMLTTMAVIAFCQHDDYSAGLYSCFSRSHAFDSLINILVKRVTAVGCDDDVCRFCVYLAQRRKEIAANLVGSFHIASNCENCFFFRIDDHVADECQLGGSCCENHVFMDWVAGK